MQVEAAAGAAAVVAVERRAAAWCSRATAARCISAPAPDCIQQLLAVAAETRPLRQPRLVAEDEAVDEAAAQEPQPLRPIPQAQRDRSLTPQRSKSTRRSFARRSSTKAGGR